MFKLGFGLDENIFDNQFIETHNKHMGKMRTLKFWIIHFINVWKDSMKSTEIMMIS